MNKSTKKYKVTLQVLKEIPNLHTISPEKLKDILKTNQIRDQTIEIVVNQYERVWVRNVCDRYT